MSFNVNNYSSNISEFRTYALVEHKNEIKLACKIEDEWIIDKTCGHVDKLLRQGTITVDIVKEWLNPIPDCKSRLN